MDVKCRRCGRKLTDPESRERGYGPECWAEVAGITHVRRSGNIPGQVSIFDYPNVATSESMISNEPKICPVCGKEYRRVGCISRRDNKTVICEVCGAMEALDDAREACGMKVSAEHFEEMKAEIRRLVEEGEGLQDDNQ